MTLPKTAQFMENLNTDRLKPDEFYKQRIRSIKPELSGKPWRARFFELNPAWNNAEDLAYVDRVYLLRTADVFVTEQLETIASEFKLIEKSASEKNKQE